MTFCSPKQGSSEKIIQAVAWLWKLLAAPSELLAVVYRVGQLEGAMYMEMWIDLVLTSKRVVLMLYQSG